MRLRMSENSLFAILLRSRWWASAAVALGIAAVSRALLPDDLWPYGAAGAVPFLVISALAARRQWGTPTPARIEAVAQACRAMPRVEFVALLETALKRDGHMVERLGGAAAADLLAQKAGRRTLYACARWKAASSGVEPVRALVAEIAKSDVHDAVFVALGDVAADARALMAREGIRLLGGAQLATLLRGVLPR